MNQKVALINNNGDIKKHAYHCFSDYTLCGLCLEGFQEGNIDEAKDIVGLIDCPNCIKIILYCKTLRLL